MIESIIKTIQGEKLIVEVVCKVRKYATNPVKLLTTEEIVDILKEEYNIVETLKIPDRPVGNTKRQKIRTSGTWEFKLQKEAKSEPTAKAAPKQKQQPTRKNNTTKKQKQQSSIRSRMSNLARKED